MPSLAILEGLIGTGCAVACLYYARLGAIAGPPYSVQIVAAPWHSALGEYARRNPFAAIFGALAFGFLVSSWSMYALPRPVNPEPRAVERWHTITKNVATPDPAQAAKIVALQTTVNTDTATIAGQNEEVARLKQLLAKYTTRRGVRSTANTGAAETKENPNSSEATAAALNKTFNPASAAAGGAPSSQPPPGTTQTTATPPGNAAATPSGSPQNPAGTPPH